MDTAEFLALLEEAIEAEPGTIGMDDKLADHDFDSLATLGFIAAVDSKLGVSLDAAELAKAETPADLLKLVDASTSA